MARKQMVKPVTVDMEVAAEEKPKRRTTHGIVCECGSADVEIVRTQDLGRQYPAFINRNGSKRVRRYCKCGDCGASFNRTYEITERPITN